MFPSFEGFGVCIVLLLMGALMRAPLIVPMTASLAFGSTAIAALPALGGATPLIFTVFTFLFIISILFLKFTKERLLSLLNSSVAVWMAFAMIIYVAIGAYLLPRLFANTITIFLVSHESGRVIEAPLQPSSGNVTQGGYLVLGLLVFVVLRIRLQQRSTLQAARRGLFAFATLNALLGGVDLSAKLLGAGDVLLPIRTASYALLTDVEQAGFARIVGGFSEASAFGAAGLASLAFAFTQWRATGSRKALMLWLATAGLLVLSTSSTAYVGLGILAILFVTSNIRAFIYHGFSRQDVFLCAILCLCIVTLCAIVLWDQHIFDSSIRLSNETLFDKSQSISAQERSYWNMHSLQSVFETNGLGLGVGSSRASNWPTAVVSQLGIIGAIPLIILLISGLRSLEGIACRNPDRDIIVLFDSARATGIASLAGGLVTGSSPDPGLLFFICMATTISCRSYLARTAHALVEHSHIYDHRILPPASRFAFVGIQ